MYQVFCDNCGNPKRVNSYYLKLYKHHFCCRHCYFEYKHSHPEEFNGKHIHRVIRDFAEANDPLYSKREMFAKNNY